MMEKVFDLACQSAPAVVRYLLFSNFFLHSSLIFQVSPCFKPNKLLNTLVLKRNKFIVRFKVLLLESGILWLAMKNVHSNVVFSDNLQHLDDLLTTMHRNQDHKKKMKVLTFTVGFPYHLSTN